MKQRREPAIQMSASVRLQVQEQIASGTDELSPQLLFKRTNTVLLLAIEAGLIDADLLARFELGRRGRDADGVWCGRLPAQWIHVLSVTEYDHDAAETAIAKIANLVLNLGTLDTRGVDTLDFHALSVWSIREALLAAYNAGAQEAAIGRATTQGG